MARVTKVLSPLAYISKKGNLSESKNLIEHSFYANVPCSFLQSLKKRKTLKFTGRGMLYYITG